MKFIPFILIMLLSCNKDSDLDCSIFSIVEVNKTNMICESNGEIEVSTSGGTGSIEFSIDGVTFQSIGVFSVPEGLYTVTARDENMCTSSTEISVGVGTNTIFISAIQSDVASCGESDAGITVIASGGDGILKYRLDNGNFQTSNMFANLSAGIYNVTVQDSSGCEISRDEQVLTSTSLNNQILPILEANCAITGCHNGDNGTALDWTSSDNVIGMATEIKTSLQAGTEPPANSGQSLTVQEIELIICWVDDGAKNN